MNAEKIGAFISQLRHEKGLTQQELADQLHISDRTVSKWERGRGLPDVSLLGQVAAALDVTLDQLMEGEPAQNAPDGGNMKRSKFYVCPSCGNVTLTSGKASISCCGRTLEPLQAQPADQAHALTVEDQDGELYATLTHPMEKSHFIAFVAVVGFDRALLVRMYPEQDAALRLPRIPGAQYYVYCTDGGLFLMPRQKR